MNNSLNMDEPVSPRKPTDSYKEREAWLVKVIEALNAVHNSKEWSTLKGELFDGALESVEKQLVSEAEKLEICLPNLYRLQGERKWAKKYSKLELLAETYRVELANIRKVLINPPN